MTFRGLAITTQAMTIGFHVLEYFQTMVLHFAKVLQTTFGIQFGQLGRDIRQIHHRLGSRDLGPNAAGFWD
jgi:hypothetical protein